MRILVVAERLGPSGGMERYLDLVLTQFARDGAQVHVLAGRSDAVPPGVTAETIALADEHDPPSAAARAATERALRTFGADVAVAHNILDAGILEALRDAPRFVYHVHDHRPFCPNGDRVYPRGQANCTAPLGAPCLVHSLLHGCAYGPRPATLRLVRERERLRDAVARADRTVVTSQYCADRAVASGIAAERIVTIPPPLPDDAYAAAVQAGAGGTLVFAGRVVPQKGLDSLVRAVAHVAARTRPTIEVYGEGPALADACSVARKLGVALVAHGVAAPDRLRAAMDAAAFVVVPSRWAEPFGYVGIEAFARGKAVVAFAGGGVGEWLGDGVNGLAVAQGDERALGRAIATLLNEDPLRERLALAARASSERFRLGSIAERLRAVYGGSVTI